jgi:DNA-binding TFAR19-related protein (PDSD5 family)
LISFEEELMPEDDELDLIKRRRMLELRRRSLEQQNKSREEETKKPIEIKDSETVLRENFIDRADEVWEAAKNQYPQVSEQVGKAIVQATQSGKLKERITGEQLLWLFERIGIHVRLQTHIRIVESGEIKSIAQKLKED